MPMHISATNAVARTRPDLAWPSNADAPIALAGTSIKIEYNQTSTTAVRPRSTD